MRTDAARLTALSQKVSVGVRTLHTAETLDLSHQELDDRDAPGLAALVNSNPGLRVVDLSHNALGATALHAIAAALAARAAPASSKKKDDERSAPPTPIALRVVNVSYNGLVGAEGGEVLSTPQHSTAQRGHL